MLRKLAVAFFLVFIFTLPWENVLIVQGVGTIAQLVGFGALPVVTIYLLAQGRHRFHWILFWIALFVAWTGITLLWVHSPDSDVRVRTFFQLMIMVWLILQMARRDEEVRWAFAAYILGCYVSAISSVHNYLSGVEEHYQRFAAAGFDPNDTALTLVLGLAIAWYFVLTSRGILLLVALVYLPLGSIAVLLTGSRAGFLALLVASTYPLVMMSHSPTRARSLAATAALLAVVGGTAILQLVPEATWARLATTWDEIGEGTLNYRRMIWALGLTLFDRAPLVGVGAANFTNALEQAFGWSVAPHNVFLSIAVEFGLLGFFVFAAILFSAFVRVPRMPMPERRLWYMLGIILCIAFMSLNWEWRKQTWVVLGLAAAHSAALVQPRSRSVGQCPSLQESRVG